MKTRLQTLFFLPVLVAGLAFMLTGQTIAQTFTNLHNFTGPPDGENPQAGLVISGNTLYGACDSGGGSGIGTVFAVNSDGTGFTTLHSFNFTPAFGFSSPNSTNSDGAYPDGTLVLSGNTLYGTAYWGGANGNGTVFAVNTNGTGFTTLHNFAAGSGSFPYNYTNSDGAGPEAGVIISGNTLYGTTEKGGSSGYGAVFKVNTDGTGFANLHSFTNGSDGSVPHSLVMSGNTLYGVALGISGNGAVFALNTDGSGFTTLHGFTATNFTVPAGGLGPAPGYTNSDGVLPTSLTLSGNTLYGTALFGGANGNGTIFALNTDGTGFTNLHSFAATAGINYTNNEGTHPNTFAGLILSGNTLYGTAQWGGTAGNGTVFALHTDGTGFTTAHSFTGVDGANPYASLTLSSNTLFGTTQHGGGSGDGTVFGISLAFAVATTSLPNGTIGAAYNQTLAAFGGQSPFNWTNISGALPPGLTLATNGVISGTPTTNGIFNFIVNATDSLSTIATQPLTLLVVNPLNVTLQPTNNLVAAPIGSNVTLSVSVSGTGPFNYQWQLNGTNLPGSIITTVAGNGISDHKGDGGPAINARLSYPWGVTVDATGNLFIADTANMCIRKVDTNGIITTVAGNVDLGYSGDGGLATSAELDQPPCVAVDATGNLFIADMDNNVIRKVDTNGVITTVVGNGGAGYTGDGILATNASLFGPRGVAVDASGNLFIADSGDNRIRKVGTNRIITTVAGNSRYGGYSGDGGIATNAELNYPEGVAVDASGNLFIVDNQRIRKVGTNGIITTVAGNGTNNYSGDGGAATNAELSFPSGVAVDDIGNLFIVDGYSVIRKVSTNGIISTVAGNGTNGYSGDGGAAISAKLYWPSGGAVDASGNLFIADTQNQRIRKVTPPSSVFPFSPTLVLNNVGLGNAGAYAVVVSNPYGSVTSSVVNLTVTLPSVILSMPQIAVGQTNFNFQLSGPAGNNYVLQVSTNLLNWSPVSTSAIPASGTITLTNAITNYNRRFYRVHLQ